MSRFTTLSTVIGVLVLVSTTRSSSLAAPTPRAKTPSAEVAQGANADDNAIARGRYLVEAVAVCGRCHTPPDAAGEPDRTRWLMGGPIDTRPTIPSPNWAIVAPRLAGSPPGTDAELVTLLMTGISRTGRPPRPPMPRFRMTRPDAEAVLAYVKSLEAGAMPFAFR